MTGTALVLRREGPPGWERKLEDFLPRTTLASSFNEQKSICFVCDSPERKSAARRKPEKKNPVARWRSFALLALISRFGDGQYFIIRVINFLLNKNYLINIRNFL